MLFVTRRQIAGTCAILCLSTVAFALGWVARGATAEARPVAARARRIVHMARKQVVRQPVVSPVVARIRARPAHVARARIHSVNKPATARPAPKPAPRLSLSL